MDRQNRGYPKGWRRAVATVDDSEWTNQLEAAERLSVSVNRVGMLIAGGVLQPAENPSGQAGVTRASVERELEWRRVAGLPAKAWRLVKVVLHFV
jgi:hypothetical protein